MKLTKIILTGLVATAMMATSCSSDSDGDMDGDDMMTDTIHVRDAGSHLNSGHDSDHDLDHDLNGNEMNDDYSGDGATMVGDSMSANSNMKMETGREEVKLALLPPAVAETLKSEPYLKYKIERAYVVSYENDVKTYEVKVKKDDVKSTLVFNENGVNTGMK